MRLTGQLSTWLRPSNRLFYIKPLKSNPGGCSTRRPRRSLRSLPVSIRVPNLLVKSLTLFFVCFLTRVATNKLLLLLLLLLQGLREPNVCPGTAETWIGTLKLDGPPLELKYDVMSPLKLDGPPLELKYDVMGPLKLDGPPAEIK